MKNKETLPPQFLLRFFRWFCHPDYVEDIEGDLLERFEKRKEEGKAAGWLFTLDVLKLLKPDIIKSFEGSQKLNYYGMFKNHLKSSFRSILRHRTFSFLNIAGLSVGLASCVLIMIYVKNELSYDTYNSQYQQTYRVLHYFGTNEELGLAIKPAPGEYQVWGNAPVAPSLKNFFPEVQTVFRFTSPAPFLVEYKERSFQEDNLIFADSTAFEVFDWEVVAGDPNSALVRPNTIVLTTKLANKYFAGENPIGKTIIMDTEDPFEVTGVIKVPPNSHFSFDGLISMSTFHNRRSDIFDTWDYVDFYTYFTVHPGVDITSLQSRIPEFLEAECTTESYAYTVSFEPLSEAYLHSTAGRQPGPTGSLQNIYIFSCVAAFILLIACINFVNLSTARSLERAREVAIRRSIGSNRLSLIFQFLVEAILIILLASLFATVLIIVGLPYLEILAGKMLPSVWLLSVQNILVALGSIVVLGILAGSYPAFVLSGFKPITVFRGSFKASLGGGDLRKFLVVIQFSLSITLIVGAAVVYTQLTHLRKYDLGYDSSQILVLDFGWDQKVQSRVKYIKSELLQHPNVSEVSVSRAVPGDFFPNAGTGIETPDGEIVYYGPAIYEVDENFISIYGMDLVEGRSFSDKFRSDSTNALIINEAAAKLYGYSNPADAVNKRFKQWGREGKVVGVVKDFNYVSLHSKVEPLTLRYATSPNTSKFSLKLTSNDLGKTLTELEALWTNLAPHRPFLTKFADKSFDRQYEADERFGMIFSVFSALSIFVACLGLFGLTVYTTSQRTKEIGIRKVLGASAQNIISILTKDFVRLFIIALLISIPVSWFIMTKWLEDFAYQIAMSWQFFAIAGLVTLLVAFLTMSLKTVQAANANPVDSLRDE